MSAFESDARKFKWSALVNVIPSDKTGQYNKSILKNFSEVTVNMVKIKQEQPCEIVQQLTATISHRS